MDALFKETLNSFVSLKGRPLGVVSNSGDQTEGDIHLYGIIGGSKVNADKVQTAIDKVGDVDVLNVHLNTYGGTFADGLAIYNILKSHSAFIVVRVMGFALSMGSVIMLAADRVECAENALIMIHRAQGVTIGCVEDHQRGIALLLKHEQTFKPIYLSRMGINEDVLDELLSAETWYSAGEAKEAGLVDTIINEVNVDEDSANAGASNFNVTSGYQHQTKLPMSVRYS